MQRILMMLLLIAIGAGLFAQRDSSLTKEFGKLSAKQRTRIAQQEEKDALGDREFQQLMQQAEDHFQRREYDDALAVYQQARKRRPYNVHPKVKIQDLEAFIKERDRKAAESAAGPIRATPPPDPKPDPAPTPQLEPIGPAPAKKIEEKQRTIPVAKVGSKRSADPIPGEAKAPPAIGERIYKEAGAVVIERVIEEHGRAVIYRKVVQRSGGAVHFRDSEVITQRVWEETFGN